MNPNAVWAAAVLPIVASTGILSDLVKTAGGDQVQVTCLATSTLDPHLYSGRNDYGSALNQAELLVQNGLAYENTWLPVLLTKANNPKIAAQGTGVFDASEGMTLLDPPKKEGARAWADLHPMGDPHYLMDPRNAVKVLRTLGVKLGELRPEQKAYFAVQSEKAARQLEAKIRGWQKRIKPLEGKSFVSYHPSLNYFGAWLGMRPEGVFESRPGFAPEPSFLRALTDQMKKKRVTYLWIEPWRPQASAKIVAQKSKARLRELSSDIQCEKEYVKSNQYSGFIEKNIDTLLRKFN